MPERTYRNVDVDLDDLADAIVAWFEHDGFEVQDFQEGSSIYIQARKQTLLTKVSFTGQALNVRLSPLARGFKVDITSGEWLEKGVGAGAAALALKFINPIVAVGAGVATGYGVYQQLKLPEMMLDFVDAYVGDHGVELAEREPQGRRPRRGTAGEQAVEDELDDLREAPRGERRVETPGTTFCQNCGARVAAGAKFCPQCGTKLGEVAPAPEDDDAA